MIICDCLLPCGGMHCCAIASRKANEVCPHFVASPTDDAVRRADEIWAQISAVVTRMRSGDEAALNEYCALAAEYDALVHGRA